MERLEQSEGRLRLAVDGAGMGIWDVDLATDTLVWNRELYSLLGYVSDGGPVNRGMWRSRIHPEDFARLKDAMEQAKPRTVEGSTASYSLVDVRDGHNVIDWFPGDHPVMTPIMKNGPAKLMAERGRGCGSTRRSSSGAAGNPGPPSCPGAAPSTGSSSTCRTREAARRWSGWPQARCI